MTFYAMLASVSVQAQEVGALVSFVSCPVYRDTEAGRKSGCWLASDPASGVRWDVSSSPYKPNWDYAVLVEGRVAAVSGDGPCGGPVLDPVRTSRLMGITCTRHMIPAEGFPGRHFVLPKRNLSQLSQSPRVPPGPFGPRTFYAFFEFDKDFLVYQYSDYLVEQASWWIAAAKPRRVVVTGFAATDPETISGHVLAEHPEIARGRAETTALTLHRLLPDVAIETRWETGARPIETPDADTIPGQSQRRVEIRAEF